VILAASLLGATMARAADAVAPAGPAAQPAPDAAAPASQGPLPAGKAAGVQTAQAIGLDEIPWVFIIGGSLVLTAVVLGLLHQGSTVNTGAPTE
jgi:hypothetical protein